MHSYQHNIKTFNHATRHLTRVERSLYRDLIELYYDTEQPLTSDKNRLSRLVLATTEEEKEALNYVLSEFFDLTGDVYSHDYCDEQIDKYKNNKSDKSRAGKASAEARKKKADDRKRERETKDKQDSTGVKQPLNKRATNHKPVTINHKPDINILFERFWASGIRKTKKKDSLKIFTALINKKSEPERFVDMLCKDIRLRLDNSQFGFDNLHPTTYLNGERWTDEHKTIEANHGKIKPEQPRKQTPEERIAESIKRSRVQPGSFGGDAAVLVEDGSVVSAQMANREW